VKRLKTVTIIGVGLIGGSIGLAIRRRGLAQRVVGVGHRQSSLRTARHVGAVTNTTIDLAKGVAEADLVIVCSPVAAIVEHARLAARHCPQGTLITDAGSTKRSIVETLDDRLERGCRFLGGHPLAGSEKVGPAHADADLFERRVAILTPTAATRAEDFDLLERFWSSLGSAVIRMSADEHDRAMAATSHLPHAVASVLAVSLPETYFRLTGSGFRDTSRLAAGSPQLWKEVFTLNRDYVVAALGRFGQQLDTLRTAIEQHDETTLENLLIQAKKNRDALGS
jgi:prephenate dehydrogenase